MTTDDSNLVGKVLGTCVLEKLIGRGGMSAVYLARQVHPTRYVAVKVLRLPSGMYEEDYNTFLARFQREADIIARLEHVNIVPIFEYGEQDQLAYLVMPYVSGGSLSQVLAERGKFSLRQSMNYIQQAASALDYAHARSVIHRDLKPANFLVYPDGRLVLADFGIARMVGRSSESRLSTLTLAGSFLGTPAYMSPEMLRNEPIDHRTDVYALGIVLFQMLSGDIPFSGDHAFAIINKHLQESLPSLHAMDLAIPPTVDAVLQKATAKRREDRYMSAGALGQAFGDAITYGNPYNAPIAPSSPSPIEPLPYKSLALNITQKSLSENQPGSGYGPDSAQLSNKAVQPALPGRIPTIPGSRRRFWPTLLKTLPIIALLIGGLLISLRVLGVFAGSPQPTPITNTPTSIPTLTPTEQAKSLVQQYYANINRQDYHAAYDLLTPKFQQGLTYDDFSNGYAQDLRDDITFSSINENSDGSVTVMVIIHVLKQNSLARNYLWTATVLQQPNGAWKIDSATIQEI